MTIISQTLAYDVHFSELKRIDASPLHCKTAMCTPREVNPKAAHLRHGSAVNLLLDGSKEYAVWRGKVKNGRVWDDFEAEHGHKLILTPDEFDRADRAAQAIAHHPIAPKVLDGERQREIAWEYLGRKCRSTLDVIKPGHHITELKTARSAHPGKFRFAARRYDYHTQHATYGLAAKHAKLGDHHEHYTVVSESEPPWDVVVFRMTPSSLLIGEKRWHLWMERFLACEEANAWPGYAQTIVDLDLEDDHELIFAEEDEAAQ